MERSLITQAQLNEALDIQAREGGLLGHILMKLGHITQRDLDESINTQSGKIPRAENIFLELGMISAQQLNEAAALQAKEGGLIPQLLIKKGVFSEEDFVSTLVTQCGFPYLQLSNYALDKEVINLVPRHICEEFCLVPIDKIGNILTVAMADPLNTAAINRVKEITNLNVEKFISTFTDIAGAIAQFYNT